MTLEEKRLSRIACRQVEEKHIPELESVAYLPAAIISLPKMLDSNCDDKTKTGRENLFPGVGVQGARAFIERLF